MSPTLPHPHSARTQIPAVGTHNKTERIVTRAGHLRYLLVFSLRKNYMFCIFYQVNLTGGRLFKLDWRRNRLQGIGLKEMGTFN